MRFLTGDWFLLMQMAKHIRPNVFYDLILDLKVKLDPKIAANEDNDETKDILKQD